MSAVLVSPAASSSSGLASGVSAWFTPGYWMACLRGRLRTAFKPRVVYVQADPLAMEPAWAGVAQSFAAWCAAHVGERCVVGLSSHGLLHALVDADLNEQDAVAQAVQQWAHYLDMDAASLQADWLLRRVTVGGRHLVSAAPMALIDALLDGAQAHGVHLTWVGPWWARGAQSWLRDLSGSGGGQPDASEATWTLEAREPGLVTRIEASAVPGRALRLQRLWMEADNGALATARAVSVRLASPQQLGIACEAHHAHVWDQDQLRPLLQGEPTAWGGKP